jgi:hypothetical protein
MLEMSSSRPPRKDRDRLRGGGNGRGNVVFLEPAACAPG